MSDDFVDADNPQDRRVVATNVPAAQDRRVVVADIPLVGINVTEPPEDRWAAQKIFFRAWKWRELMNNILSQLREYPEGARTMISIDKKGKLVELPALQRGDTFTDDQIRWLSAARKTAEWYWKFLGDVTQVPLEITEAFEAYWDAMRSTQRALPAPQKEEE
jgi:hypothetical protein